MKIQLTPVAELTRRILLAESEQHLAIPNIPLAVDAILKRQEFLLPDSEPEDRVQRVLDAQNLIFWHCQRHQTVPIERPDNN